MLFLASEEFLELVKSALLAALEGEIHSQALGANLFIQLSY